MSNDIPLKFYDIVDEYETEAAAPVKDEERDALARYFQLLIARLTNNEEIDEELGGEELEMDLVIVPDESESEAPKEVFPIFETLKGDELSEWLLSNNISHKSTLSKPEKVKLCEKYVADLAKS